MTSGLRMLQRLLATLIFAFGAVQSAGGRHPGGGGGGGGGGRGGGGTTTVWFM